MEKDEVGVLFGSFTGAMGLALGELLLVVGKPADLGRCLASIETAAYATLLASDLRGEEASCPRGRSLASVALRVVRAWHERNEDLGDLEEAIRLLQEVLEAMGASCVTSDCDES